MAIMVIAVPPNDDPALHADNLENPHHHSNLDVRGWLGLFEAQGLTARAFRHMHPKIESLDFSSPAKSRFSADEFTFAEVPAEELASGPTLTVVFEIQKR